MTLSVLLHLNKCQQQDTSIEYIKGIYIFSQQLVAIIIVGMTNLTQHVQCLHNLYVTSQ